MAAKLPTVFTMTAGATSRRVATPDAIRKENFSAASVSDAPGLAAQLGRVQTTLEEAHQTASANPLAGSLRFDNLSFGVAGSRTAINHQLGRPANWFVVGWRSATDGPNLVEISRDNNSIVLSSKIAGVGDVMVF